MSARRRPRSNETPVVDAIQRIRKVVDRVDVRATPGDRLLSLMQLATKWGWSRDRLYALVKKRQIPHIRLGRDFHFRESDVDAWLESVTVRPKEDTSAAAAAAARARRSDREWAEIFGLDEDEARL